ncbi:hypothetical protein [Mycobacterium intracellulare]|uniref:hypothetical protein n=1 Tax=Mycobacterium intracellulare TaxID=1767 RepID=UPI001EEE53BF|nr:hypothetical protein [Mycobacterium intracellulare]
MARFKKMAIATAAVDSPQTPPEQIGSDKPDKTVVGAARAAIKPLPPPHPSQSDRLARLLQLRVHAEDPAVAAAAIEAAAQLRCLVPYTVAEQDRKAVGHVARFLVWSAFGGVVDPLRAFTRANVDEYLAATATESQRTLDQRRYFLYGTGRRLHSQQFPPTKTKTVPPRQRHPVASRTEILRLQAIIPRLPTKLSQRAQTLLDLTYGAGARPADFKTLRGTAITSVPIDGRAVSVVALPNLGGGIRQVPVIDPAMSARLLGLSVSIGHRLVLAPHARTAERNLVNRVSEQLREQGHPTLNPVALRNRWIIDLAERIPAVLLQQLADLCELRILTDERSLVRQYKLRHAITILAGAQR